MDATTPPVVKESSAFSRMFNVLAAPGEVFAEIKEKPVNHWNWILPAIVWAVLGGVVVMLLFSMEAFQHDMKKQQEKAMQQQVARGKMTQEQADQILANMPAWVMTFAKIAATVATAVYAFAVPFFWGFIIWFVCVTVYKADIEYMKAVEAAGLSSIIYALAAVVGGLVSLTFAKMVFIAPAYFIKDIDLTNRNHVALAALNPFYLWFVCVVAVSISVLAGVSLKRALFWCLGIWIALRALFLSNPYTLNFAL